MYETALALAAVIQSRAWLAKFKRMRNLYLYSVNRSRLGMRKDRSGHKEGQTRLQKKRIKERLKKMESEK